MGSQESTIRFAHKLQYNGTVKQRKPEGKGKLKFKNGATFQGQFVDGLPKSGKIRNGQYVYEGEYASNEITGKGMLIDKSNTFYDGIFEKGKLVNGMINKKNKNNQVVVTFNGEVKDLTNFEANGKMIIELDEKQNDKYVTEKRSLQGSFQNGNLQGKGTYTMPNGDVYQGDFAKGKTGNKGQYKSSQFTVTGQFSNNLPDGGNEIVFSNGDKFQGCMKEGQMHGKGKYTYKDGTIYEGDFYFGTLWGECVITYPQGNEIQKYEGQINEGLYNGIGTLYYSNGVIFKGYFMQGAKNGYGVLIYGTDKYKCLYLMNELSGDIKLMA